MHAMGHADGPIHLAGGGNIPAARRCDMTHAARRFMPGDKARAAA